MELKTLTQKCSYSGCCCWTEQHCTEAYIHTCIACFWNCSGLNTHIHTHVHTLHKSQWFACSLSLSPRLKNTRPPVGYTSDKETAIGRHAHTHNKHRQADGISVCAPRSAFSAITVFEHHLLLLWIRFCRENTDSLVWFDVKFLRRWSVVTLVHITK